MSFVGDAESVRVEVPGLTRAGLEELVSFASYIPQLCAAAFIMLRKRAPVSALSVT